MTATSAPDPRKIVNLDAYMAILAADIAMKHRAIEVAQRRRIARQTLPVPLWKLREQLALLADQFDLAIAELERRKV